jgi:hypothetical protein
LAVLGGLILLAAVLLFLRRRRTSKDFYTDNPLEELRLPSRQQQGQSNITPFMGEVGPSATNDIHEQNGGYHANPALRIPPVPHGEKSLVVLSPHSNPTASLTERSVASRPAVSGGGTSSDGGESPDDANLRREVEQLRRVVATLSAQQQTVHNQPDHLPDEPPPMYASGQ